MDLRSVKYSVWRSGGDMKLFYKEGEREVVTTEEVPKPPPPPAADSAETTGDTAAASHET